MTEIKYIKGDATKPIGEGPKVIVHICNDIGAWGAGFVMALSSRWEGPEMMYRRWCGHQRNFKLGYIQRVKVEDGLTVINMIAQHKVGMVNGKPPIDYSALYTCLFKVGQYVKDVKASVHMPRIGCGLAGGDWNVVEGIIKEILSSNDIEVVVYDFD